MTSILFFTRLGRPHSCFRNSRPQFDWLTRPYTTVDKHPCRFSRIFEECQQCCSGREWPGQLGGLSCLYSNYSAYNTIDAVDFIDSGSGLHFHKSFLVEECPSQFQSNSFVASSLHLKLTESWQTTAPQVPIFPNTGLGKRISSQALYGYSLSFFPTFKLLQEDIYALPLSQNSFPPLTRFLQTRQQIWQNWLQDYQVDFTARKTPQALYAEFPISATSYDAGYRKINYKTFANAINGIAWYLHETLGPGSDFETLAYIGPNDVRYNVFVLGAVKAGYKVRLSVSYFEQEYS